MKVFLKPHHRKALVLSPPRAADSSTTQASASVDVSDKSLVPDDGFSLSKVSFLAKKLFFGWMQVQGLGGKSSTNLE